jgi:hypothetical protein
MDEHRCYEKDIKEPTPLRERQVHSDTPWNTDFVELQVGVTGDDSSRREVDTLSHKITSQTTFLPF